MPHPPRNARRRSAARTLGALCLLPLLGGCVVAAAAVAVPALTAIGAATRDKRDAAATPAPAPAPAPATAALATPGHSQAFEIVPLAELPPPTGSAASGRAEPSWQSFLTYALARAGDTAATQDTESAVLPPESARSLLPHRRRCEREDKAVIVDLDRGKSPFAPEAGLQPSPGLADGLSALREAGVVVMWISDLDANRVSEVAAVLTSTGLDPTGKDPILLAFGDGDRKQSLRVQAARSACVIAIAGDEREDFDELFGYLRDPAAATTFDGLIGSGWFIVPEALSAPGDEVAPSG